jgi:hypothetical protein
MHSLYLAYSRKLRDDAQLPDLTTSRAELIASWIADGAEELGRRLLYVASEMLLNAEASQEREAAIIWMRCRFEMNDAVRRLDGTVEASPSVKLAAARKILEAWAQYGPQIALLEEEARG